jgi:hypothetical protein
VKFGKEYCDYKIPSKDRFLLMQCYAGREVEKGQEFCDSNFNKKLEVSLWLDCYEKIEIFTSEYCQLRYRNVDDRVECYINQASLTLDQPYCDNQFPLDPDVDGLKTFNNRYACYREIKLEGKDKKDVGYCEYVNLSNMTAKYECIDSLNLVNAIDDAS